MLLIKNIFRKIRLKKMDFDPMKLSFSDIVLPQDVDLFSRNEVQTLATEKLDLYKTLEIKDKSGSMLNSQSWSSFDMAVILRALKDDINFGNYDNEIFPKQLSYMKKREVEDEVYHVVKKFVKQNPRTKIIQNLKEDHSWSHLEISYLLYYLCIYGKDINPSDGQIF